MEEMKWGSADDLWIAIIMMLSLSGGFLEGGLDADGCIDTESSVSD